MSAIDPTKPLDGVLANKGDLRANLLAAKTEIEALESAAALLQATLGLVPGSADAPPLGGEFTPDSPATWIEIILALDAAIAANGGGGGGGAQVLADLADILTPSRDIRLAFQKPVEAVLIESDTTFQDSLHGGRMLVLSTAAAAKTLTFPAASTIPREDGWLCDITLTSGAKFGRIVGPEGTNLRWQSGRFGDVTNHDVLFIGNNLATGFRALVHVYLDGALYVLEGALRTQEEEERRLNGPQTIPGTALINGGLLAAAFPDLLDFAGLKSISGVRDDQLTVPGAVSLSALNSGRNLIYSGGGNIWTIPAGLATGLWWDVDNNGSGNVTFSVATETGRVSKGGLILPPDGSCIVKSQPGVIKIIGTP